MINLDDIDRQLIALLRDNARMSVVTLAKQLRVARATVQNRLTRLEESGVIVGYTVRLKPAAEAHRIRALMSIAVEGNRAADVLRCYGAIPMSQPFTAPMGGGTSSRSCGRTRWRTSIGCSARSA
jgi:DNA-binding Lrp family transcriptional regulator